MFADISTFQWLTFVIAVIGLILAAWANARDVYRHRTKLRLQVLSVETKTRGRQGLLFIKLRVVNPATVGTNIVDIDVIAPGSIFKRERTIQTDPGPTWYPRLPYSIAGRDEGTGIVAVSYGLETNTATPARISVIVTDTMGYRAKVNAKVTHGESTQL